MQPILSCKELNKRLKNTPESGRFMLDLAWQKGHSPAEIINEELKGTPKWP